MTQIESLVQKINTIAKSGLYGNPKNASFMNEVSKNHMGNVSSPIKAQAFATFYKMHNKQSSKAMTYTPLKLTGTSPLKKLLKSVKPKKGKKTKKNPKTPSPDYKVIAMGAAKAKANYYKKTKSSLK
jgi:hypothetical protein